MLGNEVVKYLFSKDGQPFGLFDRNIPGYSKEILRNECSRNALYKKRAASPPVSMDRKCSVRKKAAFSLFRIKTHLLRNREYGKEKAPEPLPEAGFSNGPTFI